MKEFDFVKLTLWLAGALTLALAVGYFWLGSAIANASVERKEIEKICKDVGKKAKDIKTLEDEKRNDKTPDQTDTGVNTFFFTQARLCNIEANVDYTLKPRDPVQNKKEGFVDQEFQIDFKKDRPKLREQFMKFIYNCESQSRRIKLQKAKLTLDADMALNDIWRVDSLTFVRRDPMKVVGN